MRPIPRSRRAAGARVLLLSVLAALIGALALLLWMRSDGDASAAVDRGGALERPLGDEPEPAGPPVFDATGASATATLPVPERTGIGVGVRLAGPGRLVGQVLERDSGAGLAGARVELLALPPVGVGVVGRVLSLASLGEGLARRALPVAVVASGEGGRFEFEGVREGTYYVDVQSSYHVAESSVQARVLASGDGGPVEVFVRAGGRVLGELVRDQRPVAGAKVALEPGPGLFIESARSGSLRILDAVTDERGRFAFSGVAPGAGYEVTALGNGVAITHAIDVVVRAGEDTSLRIEARVGGAVEGRVLSLEMSDDEDAEPQPLAGAQVGAVPRGLRDMRFVGELLERQAATTDLQGRYRLDHLPPGEVDVVAVAPGHLPGISRAVRVGEGVTSRAEDLELDTGPLVRGRVVDAEGQPIADVRLRWNTFDPRSLGRRGLEISFAPFLSQAVGEFEYPRTDADGRFVAGPFPGESPHRIEFYKAGFRDARHRWDPAEEEEIEVVMQRGGAIEGVVMDLERAEPVTQFSIGTMDRIETNVEEPGRYNLFSGGMLIEDPAGRFRLDPVESGMVSFSVRARGYLPARVEDVAVTEGETTRGVIVKLYPGCAVTGVVVGPDGDPVAGAQVLALAPDGRGFGGRRRGRGEEGGRRDRTPESFLRELPPAVLAYATGLGLVGELATRTDEDGSFELVGVQPGPTMLVAFHPDFVPGASEELTLVAGETEEDARIELSRGGGVYGRVEDRRGRPLAGSAVIAVAPARFARGGASNVGGGLYQGRANAEGDYEIEHMSPGAYFLVATRGDDALNPLSFLASFDFDLVTVPADERIEFDLIDVSAGGTRVFGFITDRGEPIVGGSLAAIGYEGDNLLGVDFKLARVRPGGEYEFEGLAPGEYQFELDAAGRRVRLLVDVPDAPEYRLDLAVPEAGIEGQVIEEATGAPVVRADVLLRPLDRIEPEGLLASFIQSEGQLLRARTDGEGEFRFERLQPGGYELFVRPRGREDGPSLAPSEPMELEVGFQELVRGIEIALHPALAIAGRVVGPEGAPIEGAQVRADRRDDEELRAPRARTDAEGRFRLTSLAPGDYAVIATADDYAEGRLEDVTLSEEGAREVEVEVPLVRGVVVELLVFAASGAAQSGARGRLVAVGARADARAEVEGTFRQLFTGDGATDEDGRMELGRFAPGEYELSVWRGLARTTRPGIRLDGSADRMEISITLP